MAFQPAIQMTQFDAINITEEVLSSVSDILFLANILRQDPTTGFLEPPKEIADAVRSIEISLSKLANFSIP